MLAAENLARALLAEELPRRWLHVQGVARRAHQFTTAHDRQTVELLVAAGYVHDIGYAPPIAHTGFHPIDGARYLRSLEFPEDLVGLVAHHTCAGVEAELHQLDDVLHQEFPRHDGLPHDELLFCDLTTTPTGECTTVPERLAEVKARYGAESMVSRFIAIAEGQLLAAARRAEQKLFPTSLAVMG